jgi:hypothetical protein
MVLAHWKFCNHCGNNLTLLASSSLAPSSSSSRKTKKAMDFIEKVKHDTYLNKSTYSSIIINKNDNNDDDDDDDADIDDNDADGTLNIDQSILNAIDDRINSLSSDTYQKYKKKMILAEMLADELEIQNAEFVESSYRQIVNDYQNNNDAEMLNDFVV